MTWLEALILGIIQGITEFLPISSDGHLELGKVLLDIKNADNLTFAIVVHMATSLSTVAVFRQDIWQLLRGLFAFKWNEETKYCLLIVASMVPVGIVGVFFKDDVEALFNGNLSLIGVSLLFTGALLLLTHILPGGNRKVGLLDAILMGIGQSLAVLPGLSRSGTTISTALLLKVDRYQAARFSFLMVIAPILGAGLLEAKDLYEMPAAERDILGLKPLLVGFITSFVVGVLACRAMIRLVSKGKLWYFAIYCFAVGSTALLYSLLA